MVDGTKEDLAMMEEEMSHLFKDASMPVEAWQLTRMAARAAAIPEERAVRRGGWGLWRWAAAGLAGGAAVVALLFHLALPSTDGDQGHGPAPVVAGDPGVTPEEAADAGAGNDVFEARLAVAPASGGDEGELEGLDEGELWGDEDESYLEDDYMQMASLSIFAAADGHASESTVAAYAAVMREDGLLF